MAVVWSFIGSETIGGSMGSTVLLALSTGSVFSSGFETFVLLVLLFSSASTSFPDISDFFGLAFHPEVTSSLFGLSTQPVFFGLAGAHLEGFSCFGLPQPEAFFGDPPRTSCFGLPQPDEFFGDPLPHLLPAGERSRESRRSLLFGLRLPDFL